MGATAELSSRAIRGFFQEALEAKVDAGWIAMICNEFNSDQESETYKWLTQSPVMREWIGGRNAKGFQSNGITIENKHFESSIEILIKDLRRDKTGQIRMRMNDLVRRSYTHWKSLVSTLILNGTIGLAYDGQAFFSASHSEGNSGTYKNLLTSSEYSSLNVGTATAPTAAEMAAALMDVVNHFYSFKDDQGEPRNEDAMQFLCMVPVNLAGPARTAVNSNILMGSSGSFDNPLKGEDFSIKVVPNARLTWTDSFMVCRADAEAKPFICQSEMEVDLKMQAEGSKTEYDKDAWEFGIDAWRNAGYGMMWQAIKATLS